MPHNPGLVLFLSLLSFAILACETPVDIEAAREPVLQLDATFFANEPLPVIRVRRSFGVTGKLPFEVGKDAVWATGAHVELSMGGHPISLVEEAPGRFRAAGDEVRPKPGDTVTVLVRWQELSARASAVMPTFETGNLRFAVEPFSVDRQVVVQGNDLDTVTVFRGRAILSSESWPPLALINISSDSERAWSARPAVYRQALDLTNRETYEAFSPVGESARYSTSVTAYSTANTSPDSRIRAVIIVPDPLYADYMRTGSSYFTPVTVTNVVGGVGLLLVAVRDTLYASSSVAGGP